jgi:hypothetical protein
MSSEAANTPESDEPPLVLSMLAARQVVVHAIWLPIVCLVGVVVAGTDIPDVLVVIGVPVWLVVILVLSIRVLIRMYRACLAEADRSYAVRQLTFAIILLPFLWAGVLFVPSVVRSDIRKWRDAKRN